MSKGLVVGAALAASVVMIGAPSTAAKSKIDAAKLLDALEQCRAITDPSQRLACFDARTGELKVARAQNKKLFTAQAKTEFSPIDAVAISVAELEPGTWILVLSDHSVWRTADIVRFVPASGTKVHIVKGALGSYLANIGDERAVHVRPLR